MIDLATARERVLDGLAPLAPVVAPLGEAVGCVVAEAVVAREAVPPFDNSSMDGYALISADTAESPARLRLVGSVFAGESGAMAVGSGEAIRIMTGAPVPGGADAVCRQEDTAREGDVVVVARPVAPGESIRRAGEDVAVGDALLARGEVLTPAHRGVLAGQGLEGVRVHPRPRVGVLSTGDELSDAAVLAPGTIRDTNRPTLLSTLAASGFVGVDLGRAGDDPSAIEAALARGLETCDAVVTTGGVSVGDADFVKAVVAGLCPGRAWSMQVAIKPGKPFAYGRTPTGQPVFALAGNPVSTLVGFELFVRPALRALAGHRDLERPTTLALCDVPLARRPDGRTHLVHVEVAFDPEGRLHVVGATRQGSHLLHAVASANALARLEDGEGAAAGDAVEVMVLGPVATRR